jgi:metalloendopeptidase OMA1, mitochondrial
MMPVSRLRRQVWNALPGLAFAVALAACAQAPVTGRQQFILLPESQDAQMGLQAYQEIKQESNISRDPELNRRVQEVGRRIAEVSAHPEWEWEFTVFENDEPNAFALPGGKVGVHTGLFKVAENDDQLATVISHEVAHAIARHGSERMSQGLLAQGLGAIAVGSGLNPQTVELAAQAATLGIILPYSRTQEAEADHIGLIYMAEAGYDPRAAIDLWENFEALGGQRPPEFLSTHPEPGSRIERLQELMPEALEIYEANRQQ